MIPQAYIDEWRQSVPWQDDVMVEQDLIISRSMIALFSDEFLAEKLAFRGGTALHKLFSLEAPRYSEDLDLVQKTAEPIKPICDQIRSVMEWLDEKPAYKQKGDIFTFYFKFQPEGPIDAMRKIKVEINCRERTPYFGNKEVPYEISNSFFSGKANISTFELEELLASKVRALYQRKKGRDLFDLWYALEHSKADPGRIFETLPHYLSGVTQKMLIQNVEGKIQSQAFQQDILPLLRPSIAYSPNQAWAMVKELIERNMG